MDRTLNFDKSKNPVNTLIQNSLGNTMDYEAYRALVGNLAEEGKSTGPSQTEALAKYTQLNNKRMKRWDKTLKIKEEHIGQLSKLQRPLTFLVLTESWCGDAAPSLPVMNKLAELSSYIDLRILLRDENLELMDKFLTNGARSIPKLLVLDSGSKEVVGVWGPRPSTPTQMAEDFKAIHGTLTSEFKEELQVWYNTNKGQNILEDILGLLPFE